MHPTEIDRKSNCVMGLKKVGAMIGYAAAAANLLLVLSTRARAGAAPRRYTPVDDELPPLDVERRPRPQKNATENKTTQTFEGARATGPPHLAG